MVSGDNTTVTLTGGGPWGFRLTGGGSLPLQIAKIRKKSQAHAKGLQEGDAVVSINGTPVHDRSHDEAVDLIDKAGDTLTLQIYRGDADDLGRLLANKKVQGPVRLPSLDEGGLTITASDAAVTSSTSSSAVQDDGQTRREVQQNVFVTTDGDTQSTTFVRREHVVTTTTSSAEAGGGVFTATSDVGDVNGNEVKSVGGLTATLAVSAPESSTATVRTLSPGPAVCPPPPVSPKPAPPTSPKPALSPQPPGSPRQVSPQPVKITLAVAPQPAFTPAEPASSKPYMAPRPTFKAVPPKPAPPAVPPKPSLPGKPQTFMPTFNAKAAAAATGAAQPYQPGGGPSKFQVSATAMYSPGMQQQQQQQQHQQQQPQMYSPGVQAYYPQPAMSALSPMSPATPTSAPFSPVSPGGSSPMFNVRNNLGGGSNVWTPNMWLPGQDPSTMTPQQQMQMQQQVAAQQRQQQQYEQQQQQQQSQSENVEVPKRMTVKERQAMLLNQAARTNHSLQARQADPNFDAPPEEVQREMASGHHHRRLHIFGPPVEISPEGPHDEGVPSADSDDSATSSTIRRKKKMYADSAFYEDPSKKYPTIQEQMKLCRLISNSLTSAANKRARGARMFAKRKNKANKWVHEGHSAGGGIDWSSSTGDVANIDELDSELDVFDGGKKQLFMFRIPNLKQRVTSPEKNTKMSLKKDEFERLRLESQKCDHKTVSPNACFDIAADLRAHKGRGGRLFERRKNRSDKFIIDESNAKIPVPRQTKLDSILGHAPLRSKQSPWEAEASGRGMDTAFEHLGERERLQKMNQILKSHPPQPYPAPKPQQQQPTREVLVSTVPRAPGPKTSLKPVHVPQVLQGRDFNRRARGWQSHDDYDDSAARLVPPKLVQQHQQQQQPAHQPYDDYPDAGRTQPAQVQYGDYNPRPKAWQPGPDVYPGGSYSCPPSMSASWNSSDFEYYPQNGYGGGGGGFYSPDDIPACDL